MDVIDLREFYESPLGQATRHLIAHRIRARWNSVAGLRVAGIGYATPYMGGWREEAVAVIGVMPARQGVMHWPEEGACKVMLAAEDQLPLASSSLDRVLIVHGLEMTDDTDSLLREIWRVLKPDGRLLAVVPHRRGMWARFDSTPFGHGTPFSRMQLTRHLRDATFNPSGWAHALYFPPFDKAFLRRSAAAWERAGLLLLPAFSGVIIVEATKQVYSLAGNRRRRLARALKPGLRPIPATPNKVAD